MINTTPSVCIDELKPLRIQEFSGLLYMGTWIRQYLHDRGMYSEPYEKHLKQSFWLNGRYYNATLYVEETYQLETIPSYFYFEWQDGGRALHFIVRLIRRTIGKNTYYLFQCPYTHTACRNLYTATNGYLCGRRAISKYHYKCQWEYVGKYLKMLKLVMAEPFRPYGKEYYRDELTPYGKKCLKYYLKAKALEEEKKAELEAEKQAQRMAKPQPPQPLVLKT